VNKTVLGVHSSPKGHWVGDGFPVRSLFTYDGLGQQLSPFLLLDYAGPAEFPPSARPLVRAAWGSIRIAASRP
jgi:redox-sensitive bicupin YhaK (pirin superfamily)